MAKRNASWTRARGSGRLAILALLLAAASAVFVSCSDDPTDPSAPDGGPDGVASTEAAAPGAEASADASVEALADHDVDAEPTLRIHSQAAWVFVGDGSTYKAATDGGLIVFSGPTLAGPQTITELTVRPDLDGGNWTFVSTLVDVEVKEVWCPSANYYYDAPQIVTGRVVRGDAGAADATVEVTSGELFTTNGDGTFGLAYDRARIGSPISLCADEPGDAGMHGALLDVYVPDSGIPLALPTDIPLDHPLDSTVTVNIAAPPGTDAFVSQVKIIDFAPGAGPVCSVSGPDALAGSIRFRPYPPFLTQAVSQTPPIDSFKRYAFVRLDGESPPLMRKDYWPVAPGATTLDVAPPPVPTITAPAVSNDTSSATTVSAAGPLTFAWTGIDPNAHIVELWLGEEGPAWGLLNWTVYLSPKHTTFTFFELPADIAPVRRFPTSTLLFANVAGTTFFPPSVPTGPLFGSPAFYEPPDSVPVHFANRHGRFRLQ